MDILQSKGKSVEIKRANAMKILCADNINNGAKCDLLKWEYERKDKIKRDHDDIRKREAEELRRSGSSKDATKNVIFPAY